MTRTSMKWDRTCSMGLEGTKLEKLFTQRLAQSKSPGDARPHSWFFKNCHRSNRASKSVGDLGKEKEPLRDFVLCFFLSNAGEKSH